MNLTDILAQAGGIESMAKDLGIPPAMAKQGAEALLPAILGGFKKQAQSGGIEGLGGLLGQLGGGGLLDSVLGSQPTPVAPGNEVLGQIFGSKDVSRTVAGQAATQSGLDSGLLKKMLPILAMMVAGYMAKQSGQAQGGGGLGDLIGGVLGGSGGSGGLGGMLGNVLGGAVGGGAAPAAAGGGLGGLANMLDLNGDGNPLDDIMGMASKLGR
ncbi:hypothetical protein CDQ92_17250 [Sphingopyxis bauzanensis]|uniref:DUF937 domain-containing protein n=1 Tax=Sphingopyxis bauzanensis TaxID=651663 RepID=A0A246JPR9_9SPHN|nr:DUF937 domain-containing protein [Sphingopyxis bauzanensis]OWQ94802.1 hypothetical protein CDQ92_17250 [Sphingopyxis bauzanensis]GGJ58791.1 hypothetical protein GCM10011393_31450 [Sphingopyxis bauzanensis]